MANQRLVDITVADELSIALTSQSSAIVIPTNVCCMYVSSDTAVFFRVATGGNGFRIPANWVQMIPVESLRGQSVYIYNATGGTAAVTIMYKLASAQDN